VIGLAEFAGRLGTVFRAQHEDGSCQQLRLVECTPAVTAGDQRSFSLRFIATPDLPPRQATYLLSCAGFGPEPVFLVPVGRSADGVDYQAIFNQPPG
jgi:hypothetical protein